VLLTAPSAFSAVYVLSLEFGENQKSFISHLTSDIRECIKYLEWLKWAKVPRVWSSELCVQRWIINLGWVFNCSLGELSGL